MRRRALRVYARPVVSPLLSTRASTCPLCSRKTVLCCTGGPVLTNIHSVMREALLAARSVEGRTGPRPPVGAVVLRDGEIVGRGATAPPYGPHAEALALSEAGAAARGADLYVTLEPCCLTRHTPPCTEAII